MATTRPPDCDFGRRRGGLFASDGKRTRKAPTSASEGTSRKLIEPKIAEHQGRVVKTTGDGALVEFASVVDAMRCAAEIQRGMVDRDLEVPEERRVQFRIGINLGDVIAEDDDIFGDGVNVAGAPGSAGRARRNLHLAQPSTIRSVTSYPIPSTTWAIRALRTSRGRCGSYAFTPGGCRRFA